MTKKEKEKLNEKIEIRVSRQEKNMIKMLADIYANGNMSAYIVNRVLQSNRKHVQEDDFELSTRKINKAQKGP